MPKPANQERDLDLLVTILKTVQELPPDNMGFLSIPDCDQKKADYHIGLLEDAGLLETKAFGGGDQERPYWFRLTNAGHDFLDQVQAPGAWEFIKAYVSKARGFTIPVLQEVLKVFILDHLHEWLH